MPREFESMANFVRLAVGMDLENQQASANAGKAHHRGTLSNYLRRLGGGGCPSGLYSTSFHVLSAQGPYLRM